MRQQKTTLLTAAKRASEAIAVLAGQLPDLDAATKLNDLFVHLAGILSTRLGRPAESGMPAVDTDVVQAMVQLSGSLLDHLHANPQETVPLLAYSKDWPVVASVVPERDARRVLKYPDSAAAKLYHPLAEHLGTRQFFPPIVSKNRGVFHEIAEEAAQVVYVQSLLDDRWREQGFPGTFDFIDSKGTLQQPRFVRPQGKDEPAVERIFQHYANLAGKQNDQLKTIPVEYAPRPQEGFDHAERERMHRKNLRDSVTALKYYLELTIAPEPRRTQLRNNWRAFRVAKFARVQPADELEQELHRLLMEQAPRAVANSQRRQLGQRFSSYGFSWAGVPGGIPSWARWWAHFLGGEPSTSFGDLPPLDEWDHPCIREIMAASHVRDHPNSGFGRCVNLVLDAYLHLCGVKHGIKEVQSREDPLPKVPGMLLEMDDQPDQSDES